MEPTTTPESTAKCWKTWIAAVVGSPLLAFGMLILGDKLHSSNAMISLVVGVLILGGMAHVYSSIQLASRIAERRSAETRSGAKAGLIIGLIIGGWAAMIAVAFCGCFAAVAVS